MPSGRVLILATAALLLEALPLVVAHGHDDAGEDMDMSSDMMPSEESAKTWDRPPTYWGLTEHTGLLYSHIALMVLGWLVVLPIGVMLSIARSRLTLFVQFIFLVVNGFGLLVGVIYDSKTPDLYEKNSHHKLGWALTWITTAWVLMGLVNIYTNRAARATPSAGQPLSVAAMAQYRRLQNEELPDPSRYSRDSGQGTERNSASLYSHSRSPSVESENQQFPSSSPPPYQDHDQEAEDEDAEKRGFLRNTAVDRFLSHYIPRFAVGRTLQAINILYVIIERVILVLGSVGICTGAIVLGGIARGDAVFNILAHFIKGGIFFGYGLLTFGRWMGCFADLGWAWNIKPAKEMVGRGKAALPSAEFTESFVIFTYGASNIFLEHLAAWGGEWVAQDLEHVSISIMFFGGGLLGMLIESVKVREILNTTILSTKDETHETHDTDWEAPKHYRFAMNPIPALVIMLLGMMMGSHHQTSMLSSMIHKQWGNMFVGFALARGVTYCLQYLSPPTSYLPSRPPTELITSFCLIAGGLTFMESNKDTVACLESYGLDAMFTFVVTIGLTCLIMAWAVFTVVVKGWAVRRENATTFAKHSAATSLA